LANLMGGSRVRPYPGRWAAGACDDPDRHSARPLRPARIRRSKPCRSDGRSRGRTTVLRAAAGADPSSPRKRRRPQHMGGRSPSLAMSFQSGFAYPNRSVPNDRLVAEVPNLPISTTP
jgi:hypothetical protein